MEKKYLNHQLANGLNLVSRLSSSKDPVRSASSWCGPKSSPLAVRGSARCPKGSPSYILDAWVRLATSGFGVRPRNRRLDYTHEQPISISPSCALTGARGAFSISGVSVVRRRLRPSFGSRGQGAPRTPVKSSSCEAGDLCNVPAVNPVAFTNSKPSVSEHRRGASTERGPFDVGCGFKPRVWATLQSLLSLGGV